MKQFDVIVIGAGPSGMMAAISATENGARTLLIEKNKRVGKKLLLTGGGRCNVTNNRTPEEIIDHIPGNGKFLYSAFSQFNNYDIMNFFESHGVSLKEEDHGRMFPVSNQSKTIVQTLIEQLHKKKVVIFTQEKIKKILTKNNQLVGMLTEKNEYHAPCIVLATGGRAYPSTGSTGDGYQFAKQFGHSIAPLYATESPIMLNDSFIEEKILQGLSLKNVSLAVLNNKRKIVIEHQMDLLFTHFGLSGPAALRCSSFVNKELEKMNQKSITLRIDLFPQLEKNQLTDSINQQLKLNPDKTIKNALKNLLAERLLLFCLSKLNLLETQVKQFSNQQKEQLVNLLKHFEVHAIKTFPIEKSFVTGGGISLKEVYPKTMESKLIGGLFFAGELLDINGYTGGYNVTAAFITGYVAGKHAAQTSIDRKL